MIFVSQIERITEEQVRSVSGTLKLSMTIIVPISVRIPEKSDDRDWLMTVETFSASLVIRLMMSPWERLSR